MSKGQANRLRIGYLSMGLTETTTFYAFLVVKKARTHVRWNWKALYIVYRALVLYTYLYVYNRAPNSRNEFDIHCGKSNLSWEISRISMLNR